MQIFSQLLVLASLASGVLAWDSPTYSGYSKIWVDTFDGSAGQAPDTSKWNIITGYLNVNAEQEVYTSSSNNIQRSGGATLQIVPQRDSSALYGWTSGRVESKYVLTPSAGKRTRMEAQIRFGTNAQANKQGIWPAFWLLGNSLRNGGSWPACGEIDIMERVNGIFTGYGTVHCQVYPGGICNEGTGIGGAIGIPDDGWHTWRVDIDRAASSWQSESITWYMDGTQFHQVTGSRIGDQAVWASLAHSPLYFILNLAVGGTWPGNANSATLGSWGAMMEVSYVAHYST
ncbi:concanavalin A-like lectin/glucanase domain-containing protein [Dactylonectria estremocensis]|uniref:Concanavalin A-like lectin/glucanase domain-containing protein n=1 Tax=Dactylonectria estremocensis TaxID=1079267 RepID=A0A9P9EAV9_9HYPO|nr:concanavalin A-like lectin/glucanase domain-containing protein [Dactylonectria estremocensis]